jgi:hypothetical protein
LFEFVPPYRGTYSVFIEMLYKQKYFIQTSQPPQEMRETSTIQLHCEDPFSLEESVVFEEKPFSVVSVADTGRPFLCSCSTPSPTG